MRKELDRKIVLEDGSEYLGWGFGDTEVTRVCEIVCNTSMVGYQEIASDPSYTNQMVVMTYPIIGNYGIADEDFESRTPTIGALVVRNYNDNPSNFRYTKTLSEILEESHIPGIAGIDTRKLARSIRDKGSRRVTLHLPYDKGGVLDMLYREAKVEKVEYSETIDVTAVCTPRTLGQVREWIESKPED